MIENVYFVRCEIHCSCYSTKHILGVCLHWKHLKQDVFIEQKEKIDIKLFPLVVDETHRVRYLSESFASIKQSDQGLQFSKVKWTCSDLKQNTFQSFGVWAITICMLDNFAFFFGHLWIFRTFTLTKNLLRIPWECQTVWIHIKPDILSGLIWVQAVYYDNSYQQLGNSSRPKCFLNNSGITTYDSPLGIHQAYQRLVITRWLWIHCKGNKEVPWRI